MQSKRLTLWILFALVAGVVSGYVIHHSASGWAHAFAGCGFHGHLATHSMSI